MNIFKKLLWKQKHKFTYHPRHEVWYMFQISQMYVMNTGGSIPMVMCTISDHKDPGLGWAYNFYMEDQSLSQAVVIFKEGIAKDKLKIKEREKENIKSHS